MNRFGRNEVLLLTVVSGILAVAMWFAPCASAQDGARPATLDSAKSLATAARRTQPVAPGGRQSAGADNSRSNVAPASPKAPQNEGIAVHGHWTLDVRNPDGSLAEHRDFENALINSQALLAVVMGAATVGDLAIGLDATGLPGGGICTPTLLDFGGTPHTCGIYGSAAFGLKRPDCGGVPTGFCNFGLSKVLDAAGAITLSGLIPLFHDGAVVAVYTRMESCTAGSPSSSNATVDACSNTDKPFVDGRFFTDLTGTTLATQLKVTAGQTLQVKVVLSFS